MIPITVDNSLTAKMNIYKGDFTSKRIDKNKIRLMNKFNVSITFILFKETPPLNKSIRYYLYSS